MGISVLDMGSWIMFNMEHLSHWEISQGRPAGWASEFQLALELHLVGVEKLGHKEPSDLRHE